MPARKRISGIAVVLILLASSFLACKKYVYNAFILTPEVGVHLFKGNVHLSDLIKIENDSTVYFYEDKNQLMHLVFDRNLDTTTATDFFQDFYKQDTIINGVIPLGFVNDFYEITTDFDAKISFDDQIDIYKMDSIFLDSGVLMASLFTDPNNFDSLDIEIPTFFDENGKPVELNFSSEDFQSKKTVDLTNGIIYMEPAANSSGLVNIKLHMKFSKKGNINIQNPQLQIYLYNLKINTFYGRFGDRIDTIESSANFIDSIKYIQNESVQFDIKQPEIYLFFKNGFNIPFNFKNLKLSAGNSWYDRQPITGLPPLIRVSAATEDKPGYGEEMLQPSSNIEYIIGQFPKKIYYYAETFLNPADREASNSLSVNDTLFLGMQGDLPLNLKISEIYYQQYIDSVSVGDKIKDLAQSVKFRATFANNLPVKLTAQIYFIDENKIRFAEAFKQPLLIQPSDNEQQQYFKTELSNEFSGDLLNKILGSPMLLELKFETFANGSNSMVQFLSTQNISFDVYVYAETKIESSGL
ncbi:MAG TPA: hypothetical protein VKA38_12135 [Draconibacterium sp.]|nr:hypothetical protein [Draconibacterium sp.]